jgi:hypothetical protein
MRARSHTELDARERLVPLSTSSPSQNELDINRQRTGHVSWIKRYRNPIFFVPLDLLIYSNRYKNSHICYL